MQLTLAQVAKLFSVSENVVARWIRLDNLPARETNAQIRFDRAELLEWAAVHRHPFSPEVFQEINSDQVHGPSLAEALDRGGVAMRVHGSDRYEVFRNALSGLPKDPFLDHELLLDLLVAREKSGGTAIGGGIAIPHPRYPVVMAGTKSIVRVCYLTQSLPFGAGDGKPIETLFIMVCSTVHEHLQLLATLTNVLRTAEFRNLLAARPEKSRLISAIRASEEIFSSPSEVL